MFATFINDGLNKRYSVQKTIGEVTEELGWAKINFEYERVSGTLLTTITIQIVITDKCSAEDTLIVTKVLNDWAIAASMLRSR